MNEATVLESKYNAALRQLGNVFDGYFTALAQVEMLTVRIAELEKELADVTAEN